MARRGLVISFIFVFVSAACAEKKVPQASRTQTADSGAVGSDRRNELDGSGARIGSDSVIKRRAECNQAGHFFDRTAENGRGTCDTRSAIAAFPCRNLEDLEENMNLSNVQKLTMEQSLAGDYKDYVIDQCVETSNKAYDVYLVKQDKEGKIVVSHMTIER